MQRTALFGALTAVLFAGLASAFDVRPAITPSNDVWSLVGRPGYHVLLRHELAPGSGDPPTFELGDCSTQRNLSDRGRANARALGQEFARRGLSVDGVRSSQWCRCLETAELLGLGEVEPLAALNSSWRRGSAYRDQKSAELREFLASVAEESLVLVTHQSNIAALTGQTVGSGEALVISFSGGEINVMGRIPGISSSP